MNVNSTLSFEYPSFYMLACQCGSWRIFLLLLCHWMDTGAGGFCTGLLNEYGRILAECCFFTSIFCIFCTSFFQLFCTFVSLVWICKCQLFCTFVSHVCTSVHFCVTSLRFSALQILLVMKSEDTSAFILFVSKSAQIRKTDVKLIWADLDLKSTWVPPSWHQDSPAAWLVFPLVSRWASKQICLCAPRGGGIVMIKVWIK